ncbi:MAG TPA: carotene biosynthesis protein [Algoriphagus sp.]|uniref:glycosyltransferase 87 family protein n=1 Tax=unclassified Algoriphagus TaxID=2641541 RepID=UPI000C47B377|nr:MULTISPECIES: glycosyltransferase 87 family protein [unclassified Algoriphagus]MAL13608.1 carotene biosynthesis protein [Algoriphagus sp.]HAD52868.1 carotene biosynthesis protein [Algoriphagus sp.]HAH38511.1 carotene biosynthesis protein [Algoriphagus sp.]HCB45699.1 carotene biosynthesis protein [Algoriphagus sp.]HCD86289.1 carotene biosynthesis protein [Algoriphagus sp.]
MKSNKHKALLLIFGAFLVIGVYSLGYSISRENFPYLFAAFSLSFLGMYGIYKLQKYQEIWLGIFLFGFLLRFILSHSIPLLSDDYARFLWDGEIVRLEGNPYDKTPQKLVEDSANELEFFERLYPYLNSPNYYSVYPPSNQLLFGLAAEASGENTLFGIISLRSFLLLGELLVFFGLLKLFRRFDVPLRNLVLYWLNPLVILEVIGNLHFEGIVLMFLLGSLIAYSKNKKFLAGTSWGLAIGVKLLPFVFLPSWLFFRKIKFSPFFWIGTLLAVCISFIGLVWDDAWINFLQSIRLYQGKFEFNASIYYLLREVGFWIKGYNTIETLGKVLSLTFVIWVWFISWKKAPKSLFKLADLWVLIYLSYLLLQPVIHPWYLIPGLGLSLMTGKKSFLVWSFAVIFSYQAYGNPNFEESSFYLVLEYALLLIALVWDYRPQFFSTLNKLSKNES